MGTAVQAGIYARISLDMNGNRLGVDRQETDDRKLAEHLGWDVAEVYVDNDVSATSKKPRPAYRRLLADIEAGKVNAIVVWHPDRLYRRVTDLAELVEVCKRHDVAIATVNAGHIDLITPTGRLVAGLLAQVATYEVEHKAERWSRSWQQAREQGRPVRTGSRTYGYTRDGQIDPAEADVVRRMATDVLTGVPILTVARWLEAEGHVGTRGKPFTPAAVKRLLTNPRIAGWSTLSGQIVADGQWDPIIDRETFETLRAVLGSRTRAYVPRKALLNGLIFCGHPDCGHRLITSATGKGVRTYRCPNRPGQRGCGRLNGTAAYIEEVVEAYAREILSNPDVRRRITALRARPGKAQADLVAVEQRILELEKQLDEPGGTPVETLTRAIGRAHVRKDELLDQLKVRSDVPLPSSGEEWPAELLQRRALVDLVVAKVTLLPATKASRLGFDAERVQILDR